MQPEIKGKKCQYCHLVVMSEITNILLVNNKKHIPGQLHTLRGHYENSPLPFLLGDDIVVGETTSPGKIFFPISEFCLSKK